MRKYRDWNNDEKIGFWMMLLCITFMSIAELIFIGWI